MTNETRKLTITVDLVVDKNDACASARASTDIGGVLIEGICEDTGLSIAWAIPRAIAQLMENLQAKHRQFRLLGDEVVLKPGAEKVRDGLADFFKEPKRPGLNEASPRMLKAAKDMVNAISEVQRLDEEEDDSDAPGKATLLSPGSERPAPRYRKL